jgi:hypothetical protein
MTRALNDDAADAMPADVQGVATVSVAAFRSAGGAVNGAVHWLTGRDATGVDVTTVPRIGSSAVLHGSRRDQT